MRITVRVKPNSKKNEVITQPDGTYLVSVKAPPVEGKANNLLIEILGQHFDRPKRDITILRGAAGRIKIVEIL